MKQVINIKVIAFVCILMTSCSKDFIELNPESTISVDVVYKTDKDFQDAVTGCYNSLQIQYRNFWLFGDIRADDSRADLVQGNETDLMNNFTLDNSAAILRTTWQNYYIMINRSNSILDRIKDKDASTIPNKARYTGEAEFFRALAYFDLIRIFGGVPMITTPVSIDDSYKIGRTSVDDIYTKVIIPDFLDAISKLPVSYSGTDVGRVTKGAAKALLGRVYMTRKDFVNAETTLREVTTMGYALLPNYNDLFDYTKNEHHSEYIFDVEYEEGMGGIGSPFTGLFCPNVTVISDFFGVNGFRKGTNNPTEGLNALFVTGDKRKGITVATGITDKNGVFQPLPPAQGKFFTEKYMTPVANTDDSRANWKVIRYADVLLMLAEALNENGKTPEALTYLNMVRTRASVPGYTGLSKEAARDNIYAERRLELSFEGVRWFDLIRTGKALETMQASGMKAYMAIFPIPLSQIQAINDPSILSQNPGYD
jgi:hypothetical protein